LLGLPEHRRHSGTSSLRGLKASGLRPFFWPMSETSRALRALLERIFEDGVVEPSERTDLQAFYRRGGLTVAEARTTFAAFVDDTWGEVVSDGVITDDELQKLEAIVRELRLPADAIPHLKALSAARAKLPSLCN
jgi:hypothetical protein